MTSFGANHGTGRDNRDTAEARSGQGFPQVAPKGLLREPLLWEEFLSAPCPGPAGTWPCALPLGHGGDHARFVEAEPVPARDLSAENAELRMLLRTSARLLADWPFTRGASFRRDLVARIGKAVR